MSWPGADTGFPGSPNETSPTRATAPGCGFWRRGGTASVFHSAIASGPGRIFNWKLGWKNGRAATEPTQFICWHKIAQRRDIKRSNLVVLANCHLMFRQTAGSSARFGMPLPSKGRGGRVRVQIRTNDTSGARTPHLSPLPLSRGEATERRLGIKPEVALNT